MSEIPPEVTALAMAWGHWQNQESFPFAPDHCINGTRVAIETLRRQGIAAQPVSVRLMLFNRFAWDLYSRGIEIDKWPEHAWSIGVSDNNEPPRPLKWHGHLIAEGEDFLLDLSARQFERKGLIVSPTPLLVPNVLPDDDGWALFTDEYDQVLMLNRWPQNSAWRRAPGWVNAPAPEVMRQIEHRMSAALADRKDNHDN